MYDRVLRLYGDGAADFVFLNRSAIHRFRLRSIAEQHFHGEEVTPNVDALNFYALFFSVYDAVEFLKTLLYVQCYGAAFIP